jgi:hypothetical protein
MANLNSLALGLGAVKGYYNAHIDSMTSCFHRLTSLTLYNLIANSLLLVSGCLADYAITKLELLNSDFRDVNTTVVLFRAVAFSRVKQLELLSPTLSKIWK